MPLGEMCKVVQESFVVIGQIRSAVCCEEGYEGARDVGISGILLDFCGCGFKSSVESPTRSSICRSTFLVYFKVRRGRREILKLEGEILTFTSCQNLQKNVKIIIKKIKFPT